MNRCSHCGQAIRKRADTTTSAVEQVLTGPMDASDVCVALPKLTPKAVYNALTNLVRRERAIRDGYGKYRPARSPRGEEMK